MSKLKVAVGFITLIVMGFLVYALCTGLGALVALIFMIVPVWQIIIGTLVGSVGVLIYLGMDDKQ
jgi:hypothetical protein